MEKKYNSPVQIDDKESSQQNEGDQLGDDDEEGTPGESNGVKEDPGHGWTYEGAQGKDRRPEAGDEPVGVDGVRKSVEDGRLVRVRKSSHNLCAETDS